VNLDVLILFKINGWPYASIDAEAGAMLLYLKKRDFIYIHKKLYPTFPSLHYG
jgi:hypothetical protein